MANYPNLTSYLGNRKPRVAPTYQTPQLTIVLKVSILFVLLFFLYIVVTGFGFVPLPIFAALLAGSYVFIRRATRSPRPGRLPLRVRSLPGEEVDEMERGAAAWFRIGRALEQAAWSGTEIPESRRSAAQEILESASAVVQRLVHEPMSLEDRAWIAFGLERLADEVERPPEASVDEIGYAINNRHALRLANELLKKRP